MKISKRIRIWFTELIYRCEFKRLRTAIQEAELGIAIHVDMDHGDNLNSGFDPDRPLRTINEALKTIERMKDAANSSHGKVATGFILMSATHESKKRIIPWGYKES